MGISLERNNLGNNAENMKFLVEGLKKQINYLQILDLDLSNNNLGANVENM